MSKDETVFDEKVLPQDLESLELTVDPKAEKALLRRMDLRLAPLFGMMFFFSYLDRANIGNARVAGLMEDLNLTEAQFSTISSVLYATYVTVMVPGALLMKKVRADWFMSGLVMSWSIITIFTVFVQSYGGMIAVRVLLGLFEGPIFVCMSVYTSNCFMSHELGKRFSYFFVSAAISSAFGGLIATGITNINSGPLERWRYLFLIEGILSFIAGVLVFFLLPADPESICRTDEERHIYKVRKERMRLFNGPTDFEAKQVWDTFKVFKTYTSFITQFFQDISMYGFTTFLPAILKIGLGFDAMQAQYLTIPVYLLAGAIFLTAARISDRYRIRGVLIFSLNWVTIVGYIIVVAVPNNAVKYFGCYLITASLYTGVGLNESWIASNTAPSIKRATAIGLNQCIGNIAGVVAPQVFRASPYHLGLYFTIGCLVGANVLVSIQSFLYRRENKKRELRQDEAEDDAIEQRKGDQSVKFKFII